MGQISYQDFQKVELRVAQILSVEDHPNADKLLVMQIDLGDEQRQIVAGLRPYYENETLVGKKIIVVANHEDGSESRVLLVSAKGEIEGTFWNSGHVKAAVAFDLDRDGTTEIWLAGACNESNTAIVAVFHPEHFDGCAPCLRERCPEWEDRADGPLYYLRLHPSHYNKHLRNHPDHIEVMRGEVRVDVDELDKKYDYVFGKSGKVSVELQDTYRLFLRSLPSDKSMGQLEEELVEELEEGIFYWDGEEWSGKPTFWHRH